MLGSVQEDTVEISTTRSKLWEQNSDKDEIQILIEVPLDTKASQIKVKFKSDRIFIQLPASSGRCREDISAADVDADQIARMCQPDGARLFGRVIVDECTWLLQDSKDSTSTVKRYLTISLSQSRTGISWPILLEVE